MKLKIYYFLMIVFIPIMKLYAQNVISMPEDYQGFWEIQSEPKKTDGLEINKDYILFDFQIWYVHQMERSADTTVFVLYSNAGKKSQLRLWLKSPEEMLVDVSNGNGHWRMCNKKFSLPLTKVLMPDEYPPYIYKEWTSDENGTLFCRFYDTDKLYYEGKEWQILRLGNCKNIEYRVLAKSGNVYKAIYIQRPSPFSCVLVSEDSSSQLVRAMAVYKDIYRIFGNWINKDSKEWMAGFYEDFAIYKNEFWNYRNVVKKENTIFVSLAKKEEEIILRLKIRKDSLCELIRENDKQLCSRWDGELPRYTQKDTSSFKKCNYQSDTVVFNGYLRNSDTRPGDTFDVRVYDIITDEYIDYKAKIDSLKCFRLKFPVLGATYIVGLGVVEPGDRTCLYDDLRSHCSLFMGDNARLHQEMEDPRNIFMETKTTKVNGNLEYLLQVKSIFEKKMDKLNNHRLTYPFLSDKFNQYYKNKFFIELAYQVGQHAHQRHLGDTLPKEYVDYWEKLIYSLPQPYTLEDRITFVLNDFSYYQEMKNLQSISGNMVLDELVSFGKENKVNFTKPEKRMLKLYEYLKQPATDSIQYRKWKQEFLQGFLLLDGLLERDEVEEFSNRLIKQAYLESSIGKADSLEQHLKELLIARKFYRYLKGDRENSLEESLLIYFNEQVTTPEFRKPVLDWLGTDIDKRKVTSISLLNKEMLDMFIEGFERLKNFPDF